MSSSDLFGYNTNDGDGYSSLFVIEWRRVEGGWKEGGRRVRNMDREHTNYEGQGVILSCLHLRVIIVWI